MKSKLNVIKKQSKICKDFRELAERQNQTIGYIDIETKVSRQNNATIADQVDMIIVNGKPTFLTSVPPCCLFEDSKRLLNM